MDLKVQNQNLIRPLRTPGRTVGGESATPSASPMVGQDAIFLSGGPPAPPAAVAPQATAPVAQEMASAPPAPKAPLEDVGGWLVSGGCADLSSDQNRQISNSLEVSLAAAIAKVTGPPQVAPSANHPGVELHNHLLGVVDTEYFIQKCAGGDPKVLLTQLERMFRERPGLRQEAPEVGKILEATSHTPGLTPQMARKHLERVLTASPSTPFDDVYTPRDELVKHHLELTSEQMDEVLTSVTHGRMDKGAHLSPEDCRRLRKNLGENLTRASAQQLVTVGGITPTQAVALTSRMIDRRYESFVEDSQRVLLKDNIHYSEQSISLNKLGTRLPESMMKRVQQRLQSEGLQSDMRYLAMVGTTYLSEGYLDQTSPASGMPLVFEQEGLEVTPQQFQRLMKHFGQNGATHGECLKAIANAAPKELRALGLSAEQSAIVTGGLPPSLKSGLEEVARRGDVMGIDVASPEKEPFTARGMKNFDEMYDILKSAAQERGRPLVMRPHVGEGYPEMPEGSHGFHRYKVATCEGSSEPKHYSLASANLETLISHLEARGYNAAQGAADGVIVRFGHATHLTQSQTERIKALGIYAEANLGSNVQTGALQPVQGGHFFENHPLLSLLYHEVPTVLNTDAHGVMHTSLKQEYEQADRLLTMFARNKTSFQVGEKHVYYRDLSPDEKKRFDPKLLRQWAKDYETAVRVADQSDTSR